ncbi:MAG: SLC13 family permease [Sphaerochaetaceae bacterium]|nr:SLC13 family permease [Spirochaetales bacterium]MDY5499417.1 SLC13 family permease [Sphaerochaetaceae bacterium]
MLLAILGYLLIIIMMAGLLKGKLTPVVAFVVLPIFFALIAGFSPIEIGEFVKDGVPKTLSATALALFATAYFAIMTEEGLFDPAVSFLSRKAGGNVVAIMIITVIIAAISHLDTGMTSTILVTIPAMLPLYRKFKIKSEYLFLLMSQSIGVVNLLPHGGGMVRMSSVSGLEISTMFHNVAPVIVCMLVYNLCCAVFFGLREQHRIAAGLDIASYDNVEEKEVVFKEVKLNLQYWLNLAVTVVLLVLMFRGKLPGYFVFMIGLTLALLVNYRSTKEQNATIKRVAEKAYPIALVMLSSGVLVGIMSGTGMLTEMANVIVRIIPSAFRRFYGIIVGVLSLPFSFALGADGFYYGLSPLFLEVGTSYGFSVLSLASIMMLARDALGTITPVSAVTYLAPGLLGKDLPVFIKFSLKYLLLFFAVEMMFCILFGILPVVV